MRKTVKWNVDNNDDSLGKTMETQGTKAKLLYYNEIIWTFNLQ